MAGLLTLSEPYIGGAAGRLFPNVYVGATNGRKQHGLGIAGSLSADSLAEYFDVLPPVLPAGTAKLLVSAMSNSISGSLNLTIDWASVAAGEKPDTIALNAEGSNTFTWAAGDNDAIKELKIPLDADTLVGGEYFYAQVIFKATSTNASLTNVIASIIWE